MIKELKAQFYALNVEKIDKQKNLEEKDKIIDQLKLDQVTNSQELTVVRKQRDETIAIIEAL